MLSLFPIRSRVTFVLVFLTATADPHLAARTRERMCGSEAGRGEAHLAEHRSRLSTRRARAAERNGAAAVTRRVGDLVILDEGEGVVSQRNPFSLDQQTLRFFPAPAGGYRYELANGGFEESVIARSTRVALEDDDTTDLPLPFAFSYFGRTYDRAFLNSDGNLTFERSDGTSADRSLGRFTAAQPRIAALYADLDPSVGGEVLRLVEADRVVITWNRVPEYRAFGIGAPSTFQLKLFRDGRIEFAYRGVNMPGSVVGLSRGRLQGEPSIVTFTDASTRVFPSTFGERFTLDRDIDLVTLGQRFFRNFEDTYDYLVVYNTLGITAGPGTVAFEITVRNDREGFGDRKIDTGSEYGSAKRLQAVINMGPLSQYPIDPNGRVPSRAATGDTPLSIIGHEVGHLFLAYASVRDAENPALRPMLSNDQAHWAFTFNSEASLLEGNRWVDRGADVSPRFESVATVEGYAPLDQYLMGWRAPAEVPPMFLITGAPFGFFSPLPLVGAQTDGRRRDIRIDEIIAAEGRRVPDHTVAQRRFRLAFVLVAPEGESPTPEQIAQVDRYRGEFESYFARISGGRARAETTIKRGLQLAAHPAAGVVEGETLALRLDTTEQRFWPRAVRLRSDANTIAIPPVVTIGPDAASTVIPVRGVRAGTAELVAEVADSSEFETGVVKIAVAPSRAVLRAAIQSGERQSRKAGLEPIVVRVADANNVPYPGIRLIAEATGGAVTPRDAVAGADGEASFTFTAAPEDGLKEVRFRVDGSPAPAARAVVLGRPVVERIVNSASFLPGLATGGLATIFGTNLSTSEATNAEFPGLARLGGAEVWINGRPATVIYSDDRQINFVMPRGLAPADYSLEVRTSEGASAALRVFVDVAWPGLFRATAQSTDEISVYGTGFGVDPLIATATVGGREAEVRLAGDLVNQRGVTEVIIERPAGLRGSQPVRLRVGQRESNVVMVELP